MIARRPASVVIDRRVDWMDTDAAGHYHHSTVIRWVEAAEAVLLQRLGLQGLFGAIPRVRYEVNYLDRLWFGDIATIDLCVAKMGVSSIRYEFVVSRGTQRVATGAMIAVYTGDGHSGARKWPVEVRNGIVEGGRQIGERLLTDQGG
ncbi:acyl-CoA thioesterase [Nocardia salmonicida]|uniref:acyl-CoA thioesterase n=1 Tax=Nocardia salmonicida TaxID=53431 RepID=UPI00366F1D39